VLVQFYDWQKEGDIWVQKPCAWKIEGMPEAGVYPIRPWSRQWFLDQRRDYPVLGVRRWQVPLTPGYSITAHGSQGQTLPAAILDLVVGRGVNTIASYMAMTRIRTRHDLLIFRTFARDIFTRGEPEGPSLLLRVLRGENIDWPAIEAKHAPKKHCRGPCMQVRLKEHFSGKEQANKEDPHCKECIQRLADAGKTNRCKRCRAWCGKEDFGDDSAT
jgi:hypothetical protein